MVAITKSVSIATGNRVPLRAQPPAESVNWCEVTITRAVDGKQMYHNAFVSDHPITDQIVAEMVSAGRSRWKGENEGHNVLKTKGYHLEHNFGHGQQHLAAVLLTLNLFGILISHSFTPGGLWPMSACDNSAEPGKASFQDIQTLTKYFRF